MKVGVKHNGPNGLPHYGLAAHSLSLLSAVVFVQPCLKHCKEEVATYREEKRGGIKPERCLPSLGTSIYGGARRCSWCS